MSEQELTQDETVDAITDAFDAAKKSLRQTDQPEPGPEPSRQVDATARSVSLSAQVVPYAAPVDYSQQLEPRSMGDAKQLAQLMYDSRLFSAYGTPQAVLSAILAGRELGIPAMASLRAFHIIDGKPRLTADTMAALVMQCGKCKYFRCTERSATRSTFVTQRLPVEDYPEQSVTVTIEEMKQAWTKDEKAWAGSGWGKNPASMLVAAAKRTLARLEYPDVVGNIFTEDED